MGSFSHKNATLPASKIPDSVQNDPPSEENLSDEDDVPELISDSNQGVILMFEPKPHPDKGVYLPIPCSDGGVNLRIIPIDETDQKHGVIFPHKHIFKDIVTDGDAMQKVALGDAPAEENIFSDDETAVYSARPQTPKSKPNSYHKLRSALVEPQV